MTEARQHLFSLELDELELAALSEDASDHGARWITLQFAQHFWETAALRDPRTLAPLPRLLSDVLRDLPADGAHPRPLPADLLSLAASELARPLSRILTNPTSRVTRNHVMQPVHALREVDARSMAWLAQRPGRTIREKLGGRPHALGVVRPMSVETRENRVVRRLLGTLWAQLEPRLASHRSFAPAPERLAELEELERLCTSRLRASDLANVSPADHVSANNVLLDHADYSRVWRLWQLMRRQQEVLPGLWGRAEELFAELTRWSLTQALASAGFVARERIVVVDGLLEPGLRFVDRLEDDHVGLTTLTGGKPDGRIKKLVEREGRTFGFIARSEGKDCYFDKRFLGPGTQMGDLAEGQLVTFTVTAGRRGSPEAREVSPWSRQAHRVVAHRAGLRVRLERRTAVGKGPNITWAIDLEFAGTPAPGRGLPMIASRVGRAQGSWSGFADASGLTELVDWATTQFGMRSSARGAPAIERTADDEVVGLDLVGDTWLATEGGQVRPVPSAARTSRIGLEENAHEWLVTAPGVLWAPEHPDAKHWSLQRVLYEPPDEPGERVIGVDRIVSSLADKLPRPHHGVAWTVPDDLQDLDQKAARTTMSLRFGRALPVWRSVAAATSWLHNTKHGPKEGDNLLVLDAGGYRLSSVFLVARFDQRLHRQRKQSHGVYWERRPPLPGGDASEELGEAAFLRSYAQHLVTRATAGTSISQAGQDHLTSWLSQSGLAESLTKPDRSEVIQVEGQWLVLAHDNGGLRKAARDWARALRDAAREWVAESTLAGLIKKPPGKGRLRVLLVGRAFTAWGDRQALRSALSPLLGDLNIDAVDVEQGELALGAQEAMERSRVGLIAWRDWLPDLYLEVVRDGLYDELTLVEGRQVDAALGQQTLIDVEQPLVLPGGLASYAFPLETGRENRRPTGRNIELRSRTFPLDTDVPVELTLKYRYGLADAWELEVSPRGAERPFGVLKASWADVRQGPGGEGPGPRPPLASQAENPRRLEGIRAIPEFCAWLIRFSNGLDPQSGEDCAYFAKRIRKIRWAFSAVRDAQAWAKLFAQPRVVEALKRLYALGGVSGPSDLEMHIREHRTLRSEALVLLATMGQFAPSAFRRFLASEITGVMSDPQRLGNRAIAAVDASGRQLAVVGDPELEDVLSRVLIRVKPWQSRALYLRAMSAWARVAWRRQGFVEEFAAAHPTAPQRMLSTVEQQFERLAVQVGRQDRIADNKRGYFLSPYRTSCEVTLALLRLRETDQGAGLEAGSARLNALARTVRRLDGMLTLRGCPLNGAGLKLSLDKPPHLHRVSDLAWLLSSMLTGTEDLGHVHIETTDDD